MAETWRSLDRYPGYEVSDQGAVRSVDRTVVTSAGTRSYKGRVLKSASNLAGYKGVKLTLPDRSREHVLIHVLVCTAFHGTRPTTAHEVRHLNGNNTDNRAENLRWGTKSENAFDTVKHGSNNNANKTHCPRGHEYDSVRSNGNRGSGINRRCSRCDRDRYARNREAINERRRQRRAKNR
ncbi:NUMOD4 motif-containing HNH endonuclease [Mycolicibacterium fortuitum]|uniref:NUMOD4 motif-containing HNH endonuclease n=1 Tax=Mycolicibacterium fortuitum TaxID=1766 RepID=UPI0009C01CAC